MKKNLAIMLAATKDSAFAVANVAMGLERYSSSLVSTIYIYHDGFSEEDKAALLKVSKKIVFVLYTYEDFIRKCNFQGEISKTFGRYTHMSVCRYELFGYLDEYKYAAWIDFDILIQKDISFLLNYAPWGLVETHNKMRGAFYKVPQNISGSEVCLSSCVFVVSDELEDYSDITNQMYKYTMEYAKDLILPDQAIINFISIKNSIENFIIPEKMVSTPEWRVSLSDAPMVHSAGKTNRFWNEQSLIVAYPEWQVNYKIWLEFGGTPFSGDIYNKFGIKDNRLAGYYVAHSRRLGLIDRIHKSGLIKKGLVCEKGVWEDAISIFSAFYPNKYLEIKVKLASKTDVALEAKISKAVIKQDSLDELQLPDFIRLDDSENEDFVFFRGRFADKHLIEVLKEIAGALSKNISRGKTDAVSNKRETRPLKKIRLLINDLLGRQK